MENLIIKIDQLLASQNELKSLLQQQTISSEFLSKETVLGFMDYGSSQLSKIINSGELKHSKIGRRTFIEKKSLEDLIRKNVK